jgi:DNA helicase-4
MQSNGTRPDAVPDWLTPQLVVGDAVEHPELGTGELLNGWAGYLEVSFPSGKHIFRGLDSCRVIPSGANRRWKLVTADEERQWIQDIKRRRAHLLDEIRRRLREDFLSADPFFTESAVPWVSREEYDRERSKFVRNWVRHSLPSEPSSAPRIPDPEQAAAVGAVHGHYQIVARAGSGKTETLANRAVFLQQHCGVAPNEMLLLAFNRKAAQEMVDRVAAKLGSDHGPHVMTFHALAHALVHPGPRPLFDDVDGPDLTLSREVQRAIDDHCQDKAFQERVRRLMLAHFRADWAQITAGGYDLASDEMLRYRRNLASETLRGEYVKSFGEKVIANFLFEHDVPYLYERNHWWAGLNYRPDFTIPKAGNRSKGIVIEYFGLAGDPDYDTQAEQKRDYWASRTNDWAFIELSPKHFARGPDGFARELRSLLQEQGVACSRLSEDEIWARARERAIDRFTKAVTQFIGRCRKGWILPEDLCNLLVNHEALCEIETWFLHLAGELYQVYLERLEETGDDDFDGLLQNAVIRIESGQTRFSRKSRDGDLKQLRYVFVDEYQDFSELFFRLISAIRQQNSRVELFCVGDDWQAINRFAGSHLKFYEQFSDLFTPSERLHVSTNYRSEKAIVDVGNALMAGRGRPAVASSPTGGTVGVVDLGSFQPTLLEEERFKSGLLTPVILRLAGKALHEGNNVILLNRRNKLGSVPLDRYLDKLRGLLPRDWRDRIGISTAHGFKGNQSAVVIVLDALERSYPLIHPDWVFGRVLGESIASIVDENRRLFYVALTRAKQNLFIITEQGCESPFLTDIRAGFPLQKINWSDYPPLPDETERLIVKVSGAFEAMKEIKDLLKAEGYQYRDLSKSGGPKNWERSFARTQFSLQSLKQSAWMVEALDRVLTDVTVTIYDDLERVTDKFRLVNGALTPYGG